MLLRVRLRTFLPRVWSYSLVASLLILSACGLGGSTASTSVPQYASNPIKHIVFFIKENRTFDNYFGTYPGANGTTTALDSEGETISLHHEQDQVPDIDQSFGGASQAYDNGKMDRFDLLSSQNSSSRSRE